MYPTIRQKLGKALISWHPSDNSARLLLQPWVTVFEHGEMNVFLVNNVVPKLQILLQEFVINPHQQNLGIIWDPRTAERARVIDNLINGR